MLGKCNRCRHESDIENWFDNWEDSPEGLTLYATCPKCGEYIIVEIQDWKGGE